MIIGRTVNYNMLRTPLAARGRTTDPLRALIAQLFGNGEQGAMYVPQPTLLGQQALYHDAAGTLPVTADGDPVGVMLDLSRKLELGPELVTNGAFDSDLSGWTNSGDHWVWDSGRAYHPYSASYNELHQNVGTRGEYREITFDREVVQGTLVFFIVDNQGTNSTLAKKYTASGSDTLLVPAGYDSIGFARTDGGFEGYIDNISVRELPGNHLTQSVSADRPLYQTDGTLHWLSHDQAGDNLVASLPDLGTNATLSYANAAGVTILEGQTISGNTTLPQEVELYGAIYLDRPFTASEETQVTDYLNKRRGA